MLWKRPVLSAIALLAMAHAMAVPPVAPAESVGMSSERLARIKPAMDAFVAEGKLPNVVTLVARRGKVVYFDSAGYRGINDEKPVRKDDLFRIYSMTKPITSVAAMILYERGAFQLNDPVSKFLPEFADLEVYSGKNEVPVDVSSPVTMHQLLTHTAGLTYGFTRDHPVDAAYQDAKIFESENLDEFVKTVAALPLMYQPGERWHYSVAVDITGAVIESLSGKSLREFFETEIFEPLAMKDTFFTVPADKVDRFLPNQTWDRQAAALKDQPDTSIARSYINGTLYAGGGGLVSTAADYYRFAEMLRRQGELDGVRILSPKTVKFMSKNHLPGAIKGYGSGENPQHTTGGAAGSFGFGLGLGVNVDPVRAAVIGSKGELSWGGAAGTIFWIDPVEELVVIAMTQVMASPWPLRAELKSLVNAALTDSNE